MFTDSDILKKLIEEKPIVFPECVQVFAQTISIDKVDVVPMTVSRPCAFPIFLQSSEDFYNTYKNDSDGLK